MANESKAIDQHVKAITQYVVEKDARRQSASQGSISALEAIMARISAEVTKQAAKRKTGD